jgi:hypothetical protein
MSEQEKAMQIAEAVIEYQAAKVELAHIEDKLLAVGEAYSNAGNVFGRHRNASGPAELRYLNGKDLDLLLNGSELKDLMAERDAARKSMEVARARMASLGIGNLS